jgi:hypothetical protein
MPVEVNNAIENQAGIDNISDAEGKRPPQKR